MGRLATASNTEVVFVRHEVANGRQRLDERTQGRTLCNNAAAEAKWIKAIVVSNIASVAWKICRRCKTNKKWLDT